MVSERTLRAWYSSVFIAGATLGGGPPAGIAAAAFLKTELGEAALADATKWTVSDSKPSTSRSKTSKSSPSPKPKRKASAYAERYGAAFREVAPKFKLKNGSWKKNGYRSAVRAAHKLAKK
jgi:hypothetical protein